VIYALLGAPKAVTYGALSPLYPPALVLHTTETVGWPGYKVGMTAPHYTYHPAAGAWRWHGATLDRRVGTMKSSFTTGVPANEKAIQVEIVAYSSALQARLNGGLWVGEFTDHMYAEVAAFTYSIRHLIDISHVTPPPPGGWTSSQVFRLTRDAWLNFDGITAHGAVPGQSHYDTGVLDLVRISLQAQALIPPPPLPSPPPDDEEDDMYEDKLTTEDWVAQLRPVDIDAMFAAGIHTGDPTYWVGLLNSPGDKAWEGFRRTTMVRRPYYL
jgi:hypothetical protein